MYSKKVNGEATYFVLKYGAGIQSIAHVLKGALLGKDRSEGGINKNNEVYECHNLLIIGGFMIFANGEVNSLRFITASSERAMNQISVAAERSDFYNSIPTKRVKK